MFLQGVAIDQDSINSSSKLDHYKECVMSVFYAEIRHKLITFKSAEFNQVVEVDNGIKCCADFVCKMICDSDFKFLGYVDLSIKVYFLIGCVTPTGKFVEFPMSYEVLNFLCHCDDELKKLKLKRALDNNDIGLFGIEFSKFADEQFGDMAN